VAAHEWVVRFVSDVDRDALVAVALLARVSVAGVRAAVADLARAALYWVGVMHLKARSDGWQKPLGPGFLPVQMNVTSRRTHVFCSMQASRHMRPPAPTATQ
jgi:hypothetical protein